MLTLRRKYDFRENDPVSTRTVMELSCGRTLIEKLSGAVSAQDCILIYGDYDADGIMASYILYTGLNRLLPGKINWFINDRFEDGYNITADSMKKCLERYPETQLIITCDNGINAAEAVDYAMAKGITVLVTDHHIQTMALRDDCPAVDEKSLKQVELDKASGTEPEEFCGAELARRVIEALYEKTGLAAQYWKELEELCAYAAFATITDHVPMNPSNHALGQKGLKMIQRSEGFWGILKEEFFRNDREIHGDTIGFYYGPLVNASSRMTGSAEHAMRMLLSYAKGDLQACRQAVQELIRLNEARKELCKHDDRIAFELIETNGLANAPFILVWSDRFSEGVNGLTATHITERYHVPSAVLSPTKNDPDLYKGSARSVEGCNLVERLRAHGDLIHAGGHAMAAGLSIRKEDLETVQGLIREDLKDFVAPPLPEADFSYRAEELTLKIADSHKELIAELEPFGPGFEEPRIEVTGVVRNLWEKTKKQSNELAHASFPMGKSADGYWINANWWNHLAQAREWYQNSSLKVLRCRGKIERNEYMSKYNQLQISIQITIDEIIR